MRKYIFPFFIQFAFMAQIYNDVVDISKCHCYTVKIYFLPHENGITIAGNIF
ncbi:hypothetical protein PRABACTJOHN_01883 [Parabacteroides johnsonii DSM 18315]|uniref:Uncharacterized protein n=1 Tax=Parabacteroides johnsonii DSM 18315 TaxID=537006 RepID=B7BA27_9BACT|nr:hypothetical protein PRABACTJOHN_01883 [Parabacteroides johnsonii DSM 18315]